MFNIHIKSGLMKLLFALMLVSFSSVSLASIITLENTNAVKFNWVDLSGYSSGGVGEIILNPYDSSDDVVIDPLASRSFSFGINVTSAFNSTIKGSKELETLIYGLASSPSGSSSWFDVAGPEMIYASIDFGIAAKSFLNEGDTYDFVDGRNVMLPGYFIGSTMDFLAGTVSNGFNGTAFVASSGINVSLTHPVPLPAGFFLFGSGLLGLMGIAGRKKSR